MAKPVKSIELVEGTPPQYKVTLCDDTFYFLDIPCTCDQTPPTNPGSYTPITTDKCLLSAEGAWAFLEWWGSLIGYSAFKLPDYPTNPPTAYASAVVQFIEHFRMPTSLQDPLVSWLIANYTLLEGIDPSNLDTENQDFWDLWTCIMFSVLQSTGAFKPSTIRSVLQGQSDFGGSISLTEAQFDALGDLAAIFALSDWNQGVYLIETGQVYDTPGTPPDGIVLTDCDTCEDAGGGNVGDCDSFSEEFVGDQINGTNFSLITAGSTNQVNPVAVEMQHLNPPHNFNTRFTDRGAEVVNQCVSGNVPGCEAIGLNKFYESMDLCRIEVDWTIFLNATGQETNSQNSSTVAILVTYDDAHGGGQEVLEHGKFPIGWGYPRKTVWSGVRNNIGSIQILHYAGGSYGAITHVKIN